MKRYAIVSKKDDVSRHLAALIRDELKELIYDEEHPDIVISVGGDGTMIYSIHRYEHVLNDVSFVGIHTGTLGFFTDYLKDEYKQLGVYIAAGQLKQQDIQQQISMLTSQEQDQQTTQQIYDLNHLANNLEKRVSDLQVLQQSAMQTLPMIRIIQSNNLMLVDKFYAIKNITLPAWKNQISLAISLQEQKNSVQLAKAIDDTTNELLRRNAELLHQNSVDTAKANQRSVIDVETLEHVQNTLIKTVNDVIQIQKEGMQKRAEATTRLRALQENLNHLVLEHSQPPKS